MLDRAPFLRDEIPYQMVRPICEAQDALCLKTPDETLLFVQKKGQIGWLWLAKELTEERKDVLIRDLLDFSHRVQLPGIAGEPDTAERFSRIYGQATGLSGHLSLLTESYICPKLIRPEPTQGSLHRAEERNIDEVAQFMTGFSADALGIADDPQSLRPKAENAIHRGNLYLWRVDNRPVSMAQIAHRGPRLARINEVYTPRSFRHRGYARATVAGLCSLILAEGLIPTLYADVKNPVANLLYRSLGFEEKGRIADIRFS